MSKTIGENIAAIRKEKGITQEQLSKSVMVSAQAVSKWENGGMPDAELLPAIADCLGVSVDALFGRTFDDASLEAALCNRIQNVKWEDRIETVFNLCWDMEQAAVGFEDKKLSLEEVHEKMEKDGDEQAYSACQNDNGFTQMGLGKRLKYFLIVPEAEDKEKALFNGIDYASLFKDLSDKSFFDTLVYLNSRVTPKNFTTNLLVKNLGMTEEEATNAINILGKYNLIFAKRVEIDDETRLVFQFRPTPSFMALLIFARELIERPNNWYYYSGGRRKPYLA